MKRPLRSFVSIVLVVAGCALLPVPTSTAAGLVLESAQQLNPRLEELRVFSPALGRQTGVRVLTPDGFDPATDHLPVLWLLHGGFGTERDWTDVGAAQQLTEGLALIVVMPAAGTGGWYTNWTRTPQEGAQNWQTYHLDELRPFVEARYATRTDRAGRAVAGLSMGGFGAMHYAAIRPELFGFAASFSGAVDILHPGVSGVVTISPLAHRGLPGDIFGHRGVAEATWRAHNPVDLAESLRDTDIEIRTGNGQPGGPHGGFYDPQEYGVWQASTTLHERLNTLGIDHVFEDRGPGAHNFDYWRDDLRSTLPGVMQTAG